MKRLLLLALAATFAACSPDIPTRPDESGKYVVAEFDPANSVIPLPNDLVFLKPDGTTDGRLHAPETGGTDAQNEFNRDYLNHLDGFPTESTASMLFDKPINKDTVKLFPAAGATVAVFDITANLPLPSVAFDTSPGPNGGQFLNFSPPGGFWTRGHQYAVVVLGGANGVKGASSGQTVTGSPTWAFVVGDKALVDCDAGPCVPTTLAIPTPEKDPGAQFDAQLSLAKRLEQLRINYKPIIDVIVATVPTTPPLQRTDIALVWTFTVTSQAEVTFDPANSIIPFPNDVLFVDPATGQLDTKLHLPVPPDAGALTQLYTGLNTLDGFSTTAPIVSENGEGTGPLIQGRVDPASVGLGAAAAINILQAAPGKGAAATTPDGGIRAHACLNCPPIVTTLSDGGAIPLADGGPKPDTLAIVPDIPLTERTQYAAYITTDLKDTSAKNVIASPVFALVRSSAPLFDGTHSTVSLLTDTQAKQLEPLRSGLKALFDGLALNGLPRPKVALAWAFTTQSTVTALSQLHAAPTVANVPAAPLWIADATAQVVAQLDAAGVPHNNISAFWVGEILDLWALNSTHFTPGLADAVPKKMPFVMAIPTGTAPTNGWPVTMFGHGFGRTRVDVYALANTLATAAATNNKPQVSIAIDQPWHGERNTCTGFGHFLNINTGQTIFTDATACANPATQECNPAGRCQTTDRGTTQCTFAAPTSDLVCLAAGQGACAPDGHCEGAGAAFATSIPLGPGVSVTVSGWNFFNLGDLFASRDNFRQQVISNAQMARVIIATGPTGFLPTGAPASAAVKLDPTQLSYASQSVGSFLGSLYAAVAPEVGNTALDVAGSDWALNLLTSPAFASYKAAFIAGLEAQGVPLNSPTYDTFLGIAKWIVDPADPVNAAYYLTHSANLPAPLPPNINPATRRTFVQWILDDQVVVNPSTVELVNGASGSLLADPTRVSAAPFWSYQFNNATNLNLFNPACSGACTLSAVPTTSRHGFLLAPFPNASGVALTTGGQSQLGTFIGGAPPPFP